MNNGKEIPVKGYVVRGKDDDGDPCYAVRDGINSFEPMLDGPHRDGPAVCVSVDEATCAVVSLRDVHGATDVRIFAVAEDGTETPLPTYEEALTDLEALREMNRNLLDPEWTFSSDGRMNIVDARGLVQEMVIGFHDMFLKSGGAENFITYTFNDAQSRQPVYVVTIQRANGKTPAEKYLDVARALRDLEAKHCPTCAVERETAHRNFHPTTIDDAVLATIADIRCKEHAQEVEPLPPEETARAPQPGDHLHLDMRRSCLRCDHCGKEQGFTQPIAGGDLSALIQSFGARHKLCPAPKMA